MTLQSSNCGLVRFFLRELWLKNHFFYFQSTEAICEDNLIHLWLLLILYASKNIFIIMRTYNIV